MGLPLSSVSSCASSSACCSISSATFQSNRPRCEGVIFGQGPLSKALRAAVTARLMSSLSPSATLASTSPVDGSIVSNALPLAAATHCPPMSILTGCCCKKALCTASVVFTDMCINSSSIFHLGFEELQELPHRRISDRTRQFPIGHHPQDVEILDADHCAGASEFGGELVLHIPATIGNLLMLACYL